MGGSGGMVSHTSHSFSSGSSGMGGGGMSHSSSFHFSSGSGGGGMSHSTMSHSSFSTHGGQMSGYELQQKFDELKSRAKKVESHRVAELFTAFGLGSLSFLVLITMGQRLSRGYEEESSSIFTSLRGHRYERAPVEEE
ncbi:unnamed protein product [Durusdinium trenchii]|uniref:Uncharacterized protein n=1 Tax=Durusdinium trenchii TaxID=1381693 RepID=A0ABP0RIA4_9DINO